MNKWAGWALKIMVVGLLLGLVAPRVLGFSSPAKLWKTTRLDSSLDVLNLVPGDAVKQRVEIGNEGSQPIDYQIVFVKQGGIWSCDAGRHSLDYQLTWSQGADQHLQSREVETVEIEVTLPLSAQSGCMGQRGSLVIRRGSVEEELEAGVYDCLILSVFGRNDNNHADPSPTRGTICYRSGVPLDRIINPHRWRGD